ncbi:MAG: hypothetical protein ACOX9R_02025 [Armatimonadota bacterium]|jgi:hypothetical protein
MLTTRWLAVALMVVVLTAPAVADEMQDAMDYADALYLFRQLDVQPAQARQMIAPLQRIERLVEGYNSERSQALERLRPTLQEARRQLTEGEEPSTESAEALATFRQDREAAQRELYRRVASEMRGIAEILTPEQNRYLDWTPPASIRPDECIQERLRMQQIGMGRIQEAGRMLDVVKHLHAFNFVTGRGPIINDYLSLYFRPDAAEFEEAFRIVIQYTDEVRMMPERQWQAQSLEVAADLVAELGLMPTLDPGQRPGTVAWGSLFGLVTNPQTLEVVRKMAQQ